MVNIGCKSTGISRKSSGDRISGSWCIPYRGKYQLRVNWENHQSAFYNAFAAQISAHKIGAGVFNRSVVAPYRQRSMTWREYETYITRHFQRAFPDSTIRHDVKRVGVVSKAKRQIDILIEDRIAGINVSIVVDCKYFSKKIDVTVIDAFIGFLADVQASKGLLITNEGYSKAAYNRATYDTRDVEIRIIDFGDLEKFQSFIAIPYMGKHSALVSAPPGWVVDAAPKGQYICSFYPAGLSQGEAYHDEGFIYLVMSIKDRKWQNLKHLLEMQRTNMIQHYRTPRIEFIETIKREDCDVRMRVVETIEVPNTLEFTIFLDFPEVIIFMTLLTPRDKAERYRKKLEWIAERLQKGVLVLGPSGTPA